MAIYYDNAKKELERLIKELENAKLSLIQMEEGVNQLAKERQTDRTSLVGKSI